MIHHSLIAIHTYVYIYIYTYTYTYIHIILYDDTPIIKYTLIELIYHSVNESQNMSKFQPWYIFCDSQLTSTRFMIYHDISQNDQKNRWYHGTTWIPRDPSLVLSPCCGTPPWSLRALVALVARPSWRAWRPSRCGKIWKNHGDVLQEIRKDGLNIYIYMF